MGVEDFLLGRNFLRTYQILIDLTAMRIVLRAQVSNSDSAVPLTLAQEVVLQPFERMVDQATAVTNDLEPLIFQTVGAQSLALGDNTTLFVPLGKWYRDG